jgi:hypothetical protein
VWTSLLGHAADRRFAGPAPEKTWIFSRFAHHALMTLLRHFCPARVLLMMTVLALLAANGSRAAPPAVGRLSVTPAVKAQLAAAFARAHHVSARKVWLVGAVKYGTVGGKAFALGTVAGQLKQPEMFARIGRLRFRDLGATDGKPCTLPAALVTLFGYENACSTSAPPSSWVLQTPFPAVSSHPGWTAPAHWCTLAAPCAPAALCPNTAGQGDCDPPRCQGSIIQYLYYTAMSGKGYQMTTTIPGDAQTRALGLMLYNTGNLGITQAVVNSEAYCGSDNPLPSTNDPPVFSVSVPFLPDGPFSQTLTLASNVATLFDVAQSKSSDSTIDLTNGSYKHMTVRDGFDAATDSATMVVSLS